MRAGCGQCGSLVVVSCYSIRPFAEMRFLGRIPCCSFVSSMPLTPNTHSTATELTPSGRSRIASCLGVRVASTGSFVPPKIVTNGDLAKLGCDHQWIVKRTGIHERRHAEPDVASSDLAYEAAMRCLANASVAPSDVDLVIVTTITPDYPTPATACLLQSRLGCIAPAFDINAACAGFMYGLVTGAQFVHSGGARNALVVGAEVMSRTVDRNDVKTYPLFGDGAGAVLLSPATDIAGESHSPGLVCFTLGSEGQPDPLLTAAGGSREPLTSHNIHLGRQYLRMDGKVVFKWAVRTIVDGIHDVLQSSNTSPDEVDLVILHQANARILDAAIEHCSIPRERFFSNLDRYGNTSAASIPIALDEAHRMGRIDRGNLVLLCGFGAGLSWGASLLRW